MSSETFDQNLRHASFESANGSICLATSPIWFVSDMVCREGSEIRYLAGASSRGSSSSSRPFWSTFFAWYSKKLDTHPVATKCISAGLSSSLGNVLAQGITHGQQEKESNEPFRVDKAQVSRFAILNMAFVAPVLHHWYQFINRAVPGRSMSRVLQRTFWDEFVFSPM